MFRSSLLRFVCGVLVSALILTTLVTRPANAEFLKCYNIIVPIGASRDFFALLFDDETGETILQLLNENVREDQIEINIAVSSTEIGFVATDEALIVFDKIEGFVFGSGGSITQVPWDGYCRAAILDGRLNKYDLGALAYVYPEDDGYAIWELNLSTFEGYQAYTVAQSEIDSALAAAATNAANQRIGEPSERGTSVWALTSGLCQMNHFEQDGKLNEFIFPCDV
jgi:hypothetical protein